MAVTTRRIGRGTSSLDYYFRSPAGSPVGPTLKFVSMLADVATKYDIGIRIIDHDWWEELQ